MARTESRKRFDSDWLTSVLKQRGESIRSLSSSINWNEKTIRRAIKDQKITPELLNAIAKNLNVHPAYLAGEHAWTLDALPDDDARAEFLRTCLNPKWYPYHETEEERRIGLSTYWDQTLLMHGIPKDDYLGLNRAERAHLRQDYDTITTRLLKQYFPSCQNLATTEYRESMAWRTEKDVIDTMLDYLVNRGDNLSSE